MPFCFLTKSYYLCRMKILFVAKPNSENFIKNYSDFTGKLLVTKSVSDVYAALLCDYYEVVVFEWANDFTAQCLKNSIGAKVVVRIHDHEVRTGRIHNINWGNVDLVWFINREIQTQFHKHYPDVRSFFLPNAVNLKPFKESITNNKKIGLLSIYARKRKRIDRAIELMKLLPDWELTIRTEDYSPDSDNENYIKELVDSAGENVKFEWRKADFVSEGYGKGDVNEFFQDKAVVLSTSEHEGFHYTIAEGALCGCMPAVFKWEFGRPRDFWLPFVCDTIEQMAKAINRYEPSSYYRHYVLNNFSPNVLIEKLKKEIEKI